MTPRMREALSRAQNGPLRRVRDQTHGQAPWPAPAASLAALVKRGLMTHSWRLSRKGYRTDEWHITDEGLEALNPPAKVKVKGALFVAEGWPDYTGDVGRAMKGEPEAVSPEEVDAAWFGAALERHAEARDRKRRARELVAMRRAA